MISFPRATGLLVFIIMIQQQLFCQWNSKTTMGEHALDVKGMGNLQTLDTIKSRKLIVMLLGEDSKVITRLKKEEDTLLLNAYLLSIKTVNDNFIAAVDSLWPYHEEFIYKTYDEVYAIEKEEKSKYGVIYFARYENYTDEGETKVRTSYDINWGGDYLIGGKGYAAKNRSTEDFYTVLKISLLEELRKAPPIQVPMAHLVPTKADMMFGMHYINWYMYMKQERVSETQMQDTLIENRKQLADLILLISDADVRQGFVDDPFKASYPYKFNVVPKEMLEEMVTTKTPGYAYLNPTCGKACIIKTENGQPLYISRLYDWNSLTSFDKMAKDVAKNKGK